MSKIGIAASLMAVLGGTGYAVHRVYASDSAARIASSARSASATHPASRGIAAASLKHARAAISVSAPPSLPAASAASQPPYDCAAVAARLSTLAEQSASGKPPLMLSPEQADKLRAATTASGGAFFMMVDGSGATTTTTGQSMSDTIEQQCVTQHWSQSQIDCLATADGFSNTMSCSSDGSAADSSPTAAELAAVTDTSCPAVAEHIASLIAPLVPTIPELGSDDVSAVVIAAMNSLSAGIPAQLEASCTTGEWSEPQRRCFAASSSPGALTACN
jgi:hypothetical protein